ncbi:heavy metal-binding domain-containing protein [Archaeoglobus neptunius]|uniref:heavy metal-binding domain-containing protein n=1 Tax=Archaeoglobus neptunius TaxID=2798580 RepID=UPI0019271212
MIATTTDSIPGFKVCEVPGIVFGNTTKHTGKDIPAGLKNIVGREIEECMEMLSDAGIEAAEFLAYGTAVKLKRVDE